MKVVLVALALVAAACAAPVESDAKAEVLRSNFDTKPEGSYNLDFETQNGISRQETGEVKEALDEDNKPHTVVVVRGSFTYTDPEGKPQTVTYYADETGFHATGDSIPQPPSRR